MFAKAQAYLILTLNLGRHTNSARARYIIQLGIGSPNNILIFIMSKNGSIIQ